MIVDMHIHTTFSDGLWTPEKIVKEAVKLNLKAIAITDHDTIDGIMPALKAAKNYPGLEIIPGIELSTEWKHEEVHILGYYLDYKNPILKSFLQKLQHSRKLRAEKILNKLQKLGVHISMTQVNIKSQGSSIGRPHIAMVLVERGYATSVQDAFEKFLSRGRPAFVPRIKLSPYDAIQIIKKTAGISVLAHPGLIKNASIINEIISFGIDGIEVIHKDHSETDVDYFKKLAKSKNLLLTGGSDFHGEKPFLLGSFNIPYEYVKVIKKEIRLKNFKK